MRPPSTFSRHAKSCGLSGQYSTCWDRSPIRHARPRRSSEYIPSIWLKSWRRRSSSWDCGAPWLSTAQMDWTKFPSAGPPRSAKSAASGCAPMSTILGGDLKTNADIIWKLLEGEKSPRRDIVLMNAAAALVAAGRADSLADAMPLAVQSIDTGAARAKLGALVEFTNRRYL